MTTTIEQRRAATALTCIEETRAFDYGHYMSYVSAAPAQIIGNGLGQTLATLLAAAGRRPRPEKAPHYLVCQHLAKWLHKEVNELAVPASEGAVDPVELLRSLTHANQPTYIRAQVEALAFLVWLRKFARALLNEPTSDTEDNNGTRPSNEELTENT